MTITLKVEDVIRQLGLSQEAWNRLAELTPEPLELNRPIAEPSAE
ncbi:hypothetical protein ACP26L_32360 [Paenibacillus sp. S-38]